MPRVVHFGIWLRKLVKIFRFNCWKDQLVQSSIGNEKLLLIIWIDQCVNYFEIHLYSSLYSYPLFGFNILIYSKSILSLWYLPTTIKQNLYLTHIFILTTKMKSGFVELIVKNRMASKPIDKSPYTTRYQPVDSFRKFFNSTLPKMEESIEIQLLKNNLQKINSSSIRK